MIDTLISIAVMAAFLLAAAIDLRERRIPNSVALFVAVMAVARLSIAAFTGEGIGAVAIDCAAALAGFVLLLTAFRFGVMGGGDAKLITAGILWFGVPEAAAFLVITMLAGGVLSGAILVLDRVRVGIAASGVPYAVAIAVGGVATISVGLS